VAWGFGAASAVGWRCVMVHDADEAADWRAHGFRPPAAVAWREAGFEAGEARAAEDAGFDSELAQATREDEDLRGVVADLLAVVRDQTVPSIGSGLGGGVALVLERYLRVGRRADAVKMLQRLVGLLCARGRPQEAAEVLEALPERPRVLKARVALGLGDLERAGTLLRSATGAEAELLRGIAALRIGDVEQALRPLRAAQHRAEQEHDTRVFALARCHLGLALEHPSARRFSGASEAATLALQDGVRLLNPTEAPIDLGVARLALARLCLRRRDGDVRRRRETAVDHLHAALGALTTAEAAEERGQAHLMLGTVLQKLSQTGRGEAFAEAVAHLRASLRFLEDPRAREEATRILDATRSEVG
jgi:tetratricopeptide (TPR) repeat protein